MSKVYDNIQTVILPQNQVALYSDIPVFTVSEITDEINIDTDYSDLYRVGLQLQSQVYVPKHTPEIKAHAVEDCKKILHKTFYDNIEQDLIQVAVLLRSKPQYYEYEQEYRLIMRVLDNISV